MSVQIIVDSACDLPEGILEDYNIKVLPFNIHVGERSYKDRENIKVEEVYNYIKKGEFPKTSQVSPGDIKYSFTKCAEEGIDCIYISFSSKLSSVYKTAKIIAEEVQEKHPESKINVIDSKAGSLATGIIVYKAAELIKKGCNLSTVIDKIKLWAGHIEHLFILDNLKSLQRGGRINKAQSFIGSILNIKPLLHVDNGEIKLLKKVRGSKKAVIMLLRYFKEKSFDLKNQLIGIAHADDKKKADYLKNKINDMGGKVFCVEQISSVLGAHLGIGGLGIFFLNKDIEAKTNQNKNYDKS